MPEAADSARWFRWTDLVRRLPPGLSSTVALIITGALLPGLSADSAGGPTPRSPPSPASSACCCARCWWRCRRALGWIAVLLLALFGQALIMYLALRYTPGHRAPAPGHGVLGDLGQRHRRHAHRLGHHRRHRRRAGDLAEPARQAGHSRWPTRTSTASLFVQLDGVPFPVLQWAVQSGCVPHLRRLLASGDYVMRPWTVQLPCTTPASQQGILHGTIDRIPAFRWYDRELGRVLVANRPADAAGHRGPGQQRPRPAVRRRRVASPTCSPVTRPGR